MADHAKLSASGSKIWINCPGSVVAQEGYADTSSEPAMEGTVAHVLGQLVLENPETLIGSYLGKTVAAESDGITHISVDSDMVHYIAGYVAYVNSLGTTQFIEERVDFSPWAIDGQFGTADAIVPEGDRLHVIDLKYGQGVRVDAFDNSQGLLYALGAWNEVGFMFPEIDTVVIHIYQPRMSNFSEWELSVKDLLTWGETVSKPAAEATQDPMAPREAGSHCHWCKARGDCVALADYAIGTAIEAFDTVEVNVVLEEADIRKAKTISHKRLGILVDQLPMIEHWAKSVRQHVTDLLTAGTPIPGQKLVEGRSNRRFINTDDANDWLVETLGEDTARSYKYITLAQAEKKLKKADQDTFKTLWEKPPGSPVLASEGDPREAINPAEAANQSAEAAFSK